MFAGITSVAFEAAVSRRACGRPEPLRSLKHMTVLLPACRGATMPERTRRAGGIALLDDGVI